MSGLRATVVPLLILAATAIAVVPIRGQQPPRGVTAADYARAESFLAPAVTGLVVGGSVAANWLPDGRFWYRTVLADGSTQTILVDPAKKTRTICTPAIADCPSPSAPDPAAATQGRGGAAFAAGAASAARARAATMLVADALIKTNKDFDLLMIPNANHGYGAAASYMMRRRWDYFVKWLIGSDPPKEYRIGGTVPPPAFAWQPQSSGVTGRLRGVSAVSPTVAWTSGANGTVLLTTDGGNHWERRPVTGAEPLDFRDVDAMSDRVAYALSIGAGESSRIYKTTDGGAHWTLQFANTDPRIFLDAMAFWDADRGIAFSDSVDGRFVILTTGNGGRSWERVPADRLPPARPGEGAFAASGTNVALVGRDQA